MYLKKVKEKEINNHLREINRSENNVFYISNANKPQNNKIALCTYNQYLNKKQIQEEKSLYVPKNKTVYDNCNKKNKNSNRNVIDTTFIVKNMKKKKYDNNNETYQKNNGSSKYKYILETTKVEVFSPRSYYSNKNIIEKNKLNSNEKLTDLVMNRWNEKNCCSSTECLTCLGSDIKNINRNVYVYYI